MRFDDMLATLLAQSAEDAVARAAMWAQLVDVLAQGRGGQAQADGYARLEALRPDVSGAAARAVAGTLAGRELPPPLVALFAQEPPAIAGVVLSSARMASDDWLALLPSLGPTARGFLRNRRDLPAAARDGLAAFGSVDLVLAEPAGSADRAQSLPTATAPAPAVETPTAVPIKDLVARIAAFRAAGARGEVASTPPADAVEFRFETDRDGVLRWAEGVPRAAVIGETIALAGGDDEGVDAHAAGAFRRRTPFRDARLTLPGNGPAAGEWRISGVPFFADDDGRFLGFRGSARRPRPDQTAGTPRLLGAAVPADSLRQLVHELRTPLNAIVGFAEMIDGQMLGPAAHAYRLRAGEIAQEGRRLLGAIDDLDVAARIEGGRWETTAGRVDLSALIDRLLPDYRAVVAARGARFEREIAPALPDAAGDGVAIERMLARLLGSVAALAGPDETIRILLQPEPPGMLGVALDRPAALAGRDERTLLDPGYSPDGEWPDAPLLGLGFTLRLVRSIAASLDGALAIDDTRFRLRLPAAADSAAGQEGNG